MSAHWQGALQPSAEWSDEQCLEWLWRLRYSADGAMAYCVRCERRRRHHRARSRRSWECQSCGNHVHPTAGTIFHGARAPLSVWFRTIALLDHADGRASVRALSRELGVTYKTAWRMVRIVNTAFEKRLPPRAPRGDGRLATLVASLVEPAENAPRDAAAAAGGRISRPRPGERPPAPRGETLQRILSGACRAIASRGFAGTRVEDIARESGVSAPTIYRYFERKEDVLLAAVDWADRDGTQHREQVVGGSDDPVTKLALFLDLIVPDSESIGEVYALYLDLWGRAARDETLRAMVERSEERWHGYFRRILLEGVRSGELTLRRDVEDVVEYLVALSVGLAMPSTVGCRSMPKNRLRRLLFAYAASELDLPPGELERRLKAARGGRASAVA